MPEGVPYYPGIAPETPKDTGLDVARIVASSDLAGSFTRGLAAAAQATAQRQRLQLESEQMITDAALKSRELDILSENNKMDFQVGLKNADALANYRNTRAAIEGDPTNPLSLAGRIEAKRRLEQDWADFNSIKEKYGLNATNVKNPVEYWSNKRRLEDEWRYSNDPRIKFSLKQLNSITDQHSIPVKIGRVQNEDGEWTGGNEQKVPVGQIIEGLNDPDKAEETQRLLESNGLMVSATETRKVDAKPKSWAQRDYVREWLFGVPQQEQTVTETTVSPDVSRYARMARGVDFSRGKARPPIVRGEASEPNDAAAPSITQDSVDEAAVTMATESGASLSTPPVTATAPTKEALFPPTETDKIIAQAKRAMAKPGANVPAIKAMLQDKYNIDPSQL